MEEVFLTGYYNYLLELFSDFESCSSSDISTRLRPRLVNLYSVFQSQYLNIACPCTASADSDCWIFSHLTLWNRILDPITSELIENAPGQLSLCSLGGRYSEPYNSDLILEACITAHWLLKQHCCISRVDLADYDFISNHTVLFCDALSVSKAVKRLVLSSHYFNNEFGDELAAAVGNMPFLHQLELCEVLLSEESAGAIGYSIGSRNLLTHLDIRENDRWTESGAAFLDGAKSLTNLKSLKVSIMNLGINGSSNFTEMLRQNVALEEVVMSRIQFSNDELHLVAEGLGTSPLLRLERLEFSRCSLHASALAALADSLKQHKALSCLQFVNCDLDCGKVRALVRVIREGSRLRELHLDHNSIKDGGAVTLARCMGSNRNLEVVSLKKNLLTSRGVTALLEALEQNTSDTRLYLGHIKANDTEALDITRTLEAMSCSPRIQITYGAAGYFHLARLLRANQYHVSEIILKDSLHLTPCHLKELFAGLCHDRSITKLSVKAEQFDDDSLHQLAQALAVNGTLKSLKIGAEMQPRDLGVLFSGLTKNNGISQLTIDDCRFDIEATRAFVDVLKVNKTLNTFSKFRGDVELLPILASGLSQNYTLLQLYVEPQCIKCKTMFEMEEVRRRNHALLNVAVRYVLNNTTEKSSALAFERVCGSDAFLPHLVAVTGMPDALAKDRLRSTRRYITSKYLVISGIVQEMLECCKSDCGSVQLDRLSWECLEKIFSYLKLTDVA